jgi:fucose permease
MASPHIDIEISPSPSSSSLSLNRKLILAGQIAFLPTGILSTLLGPMLPILIARWAMNDTQAGNLFLVQFLAWLAGVQLAGVLLARWGFRPAFLSGLLLMAGGVATLYMGALWLGMASVAVIGLGLGLIVLSDNLLIAEIGACASSEESSGESSNESPSANSKASAVSLLNFYWGIGAVFCSLMVAWTTKTTTTTTATSAAHKLLPLFFGSVALFLVLLALAIRNLQFPPAETVEEKSASTSLSWRELAKSPAIWLFAGVFFFYTGAETAVGGWIGSYVSRMGARGAALASMMPAFFWSALTVGRGLGSVLLRHVPERRVLRAGFATGAAGIALLLWTATVPGAIAGALITGLSFATLYPITVARLSHRFGVAARSIGTYMFSLGSLGSAVVPKMVGVISHNTGSLRVGLLLPLGTTVVLLVIHLFEW